MSRFEIVEDPTAPLFKEISKLRQQLAAHRALVPALRELDDWLDHAPDCPGLRHNNSSCTCGLAVQRAGLRKAIKVLEGESD